MPGLLPLFRRDGDGRETITTAYLPLEANYSTHMPNEKPRPLGGTGASELALMDRPGWGWAGSDLSDCRFQRALKQIVPCGGQFTNDKRPGGAVVGTTTKANEQRPEGCSPSGLRL